MYIYVYILKLLMNWYFDFWYIIDNIIYNMIFFTKIIDENNLEDRKFK